MSSERPPHRLPPGPAPDTVPPSIARKHAILEQARKAAQQHTDLSTPAKKVSERWQDFFDVKRTVEVAERRCTFNVYTAGEHGPVIFCVHGGGYTGLSFAQLCLRLKDEYRVVAMDMRGHGETICNDATEADDLSRATLAADVTELWRAMFAEEKPPTVLVGHSVGGAVAVWAALEDRIPSLEGVLVIDVVEGTALASLPHMNIVLSKRPKAFPSTAAAVKWALETKMSRCKAAATISVPSQLRQNSEGQWEWRTQLQASEPFWQGWYLGLSEAFLKMKVPKVLILAGADRLDRILTIGQMQGKFQMVLVRSAGHAVHEDEPDEAADCVRHFMKRFRIGEPPLVLPRAAAGLPLVLPQAEGPHQR